ncbi:hypothetical protein FMN50_15435 [Rhodobacterales bacterium]|nr:hypothetical protein FMN50_15435 [Rhodobacterales bacterium]
MRGALGSRLKSGPEMTDLFTEDVVFEFSCQGQGIETGKPYDQDYISVVTLRDGRVCHYRDYWNPLVALHALGGAEAAAAAYAGETHNG